MKKQLILLILLPLSARADPNFGPHFGLYLLLAALWYLIGLPLLIAQLVSWGLQLIKRRKMNAGGARIAAVLANWLAVCLIFSGVVKAPGLGLFSASGGMYLVVFSGIGAAIAVLISSKQ